jgi:hypothetical protein
MLYMYNHVYLKLVRLEKATAMAAAIWHPN